jgi:hypothetical protein
LERRFSDQQNHLLSHDGESFFRLLQNADAGNETPILSLFQRKDFLLPARLNNGDVVFLGPFLRRRNRPQRFTLTGSLYKSVINLLHFACALARGAVLFDIGMTRYPILLPFRRLSDARIFHPADR